MSSPALRLSFASAVFAAAFAISLSGAANSKSGAPAPAADTDDYPLATCVVTDEPLHDPVVYTHRQPGKPDRTVRLCCEGCVEDFRGDPEKFLRKLDAAAARKAGAKKKS
jgi:hypothetical protein